MKILITGARRGLGLNFVKLALHDGHDVVAVVRDRQKADELLALASQSSQKLNIFDLDLSQAFDTSNLVKMLEKIGGLDLLINNAGILLKGESYTDLELSYRVNAIAPFELSRALLPLLKKSQEPKIIQITSLMGSIDDNSSGGYYAYRSSKAALNMLNKSLAIDNPWLRTVVVHPGWVKTDMGGSQAPLTIEESTLGIWKLIKNLKQGDSGKFFDFRGENLRW